MTETPPSQKRKKRVSQADSASNMSYQKHELPKIKTAMDASAPMASRLVGLPGQDGTNQTGGIGTECGFAPAHHIQMSELGDQVLAAAG